MRVCGRSSSQALGQAEVGDLGLCRPRVSRMLAGLRSRWMMPLVVGRVHGPGQRLDQPRRLAGRLRRAAELPAQAAAVDELQREEGMAVVLADLVDLHDVRVLQRGQCPCLDLKPGHILRGSLRSRRDHFERHDAIQLPLPRLVDLAHASFAEHAQHLVACDFRKPPSPLWGEGLGVRGGATGNPRGCCGEMLAGGRDGCASLTECTNAPAQGAD